MNGNDGGGVAGSLAEYAAKEACISSHNPTLAENIDQRIAIMEDQIARLKRVRSLLSEPGGILSVPIQDLRFAMNY